MTNSKLKKLARKDLATSYVTIVLAVLAMLLFGGACFIIAELINSRWLAPVLYLIVCSLFMMGIVEMAVKVSRSEKIKFSDLFNQTEHFFKYMGIMLLLTFMFLLIGLLETIAFKSLVVIIQYQADLGMLLVIALITFGILLSVGILVCGIYLTIAFSQVLFILYDNPKLHFRIFSFMLKFCWMVCINYYNIWYCGNFCRTLSISDFSKFL